VEKVRKGEKKGGGEVLLAFLDLQTPKEDFYEMGKVDGGNNNSHLTKILALWK
jgi:hypothetical protein